MHRIREIALPEPRGDEHEVLARVALPPDVAALVAEYEAGGGRRPRLLWQWVWHHLALDAAPMVLSCVPSASRIQAAHLKFMDAMANTIFNDLAHRRHVAELVEILAQALSAGPSAPAEPLPALFAALVRRLGAGLEAAPDGGHSLERVHYGVAVESLGGAYGGLVRRHPSMLCHSELRARMRDTMALLTFAEIDLAYATGFERGEHGALRATLTAALEMLRISNWIGTWERELVEGDIASGVVSLLHEYERPPFAFLEALQRGEMIAECRARVRTAGIEAALRQEWVELAGLLLAQGRTLRSIEIAPYLDALSAAHRTLVGARGLL